MSDPAPNLWSKAVLKDQLPNANCAELASYTFDTSLVSFSNSMSAEPTPAKSQPARVNATHGAGVLTPSGLVELAAPWINVNSGSALLLVWSVQYLNSEVVLVPDLALGFRYGKVLATPPPNASGYNPVSVLRIPSAVCEISTVWSLPSSVPLSRMKS